LQIIKASHRTGRFTLLAAHVTRPAWFFAWQERFRQLPL
jgi:hypothetical protein